MIKEKHSFIPPLIAFAVIAGITLPSFIHEPTNLTHTYYAALLLTLCSIQNFAHVKDDLSPMATKLYLAKEIACLAVGITIPPLGFGMTASRFIAVGEQAFSRHH